MANVYLFGSASITSVSSLEPILEGLLNQGHEFILADGRGADSAFHLSLSRIGALDHTTLYVMNNTYNNKFDIKEKVLNTVVDTAFKKALIVDKETGNTLQVIDGIEKPEDLVGNQEYSEARDKILMRDCAIAICAWDQNSKREFRRIQLLGIKNKPCYTYSF
jgi:hypothetical protein